MTPEMKNNRRKGIIEAKKFVLKDKLGHVRAALEMGHYGPQLRLVQDHKDGGLRLGLGISGPFLEFSRTSAKWGGHVDAFWEGLDLVWQRDELSALVRIRVKPGRGGLSFYDDRGRLICRMPSLRVRGT
jgi:hypothetical protein